MGFFFWQQRKANDYHELILEGLLSERIGNFTSAGTLYKQAQQTLPGEGLAYRFLAELYLDKKQYKLADIESKRWELASPYDEGLGEFKMRLRSAQGTSSED
jgi:hypothetical protein